MIFIVVSYQVEPEFADEWIDHVAEFTTATRAEAGNKWSKWSRSVEDPNQYILVEAFDDDAGETHVSSEHFARGLGAMRPPLAKAPKIVPQVPPDKQDWDCMSEL